MHAVTKPACLVFAGHDPTGAAGVQADIETLAALGCIAVPVITCLTAQSTRAFIHHRPQPSADFETQTRLVLEDVTVCACKIGAVGSAALLDVIHDILTDLPVPVVVDPILRASAGYDLADPDTVIRIGARLAPLAEVMTPNRDEALRLTNTTTPADAARTLLDMGSRTVLITDVDDSSTAITNHVFYCDGHERRYTTPRFQGDYHGSGCTLSAAIAAGLAHGRTLQDALETAQTFVQSSLEQAMRLGGGARHPNRFFGRARD